MSVDTNSASEPASERLTCTCAHAQSSSAGGKRREVADVDERQRPFRDVGRLRELALGQDDERDPRPQPQARRVGRRGRVAPREVLVVELDRREVVGLEVRDPVARLGADDRAGVDAHDVARAVELDVARQRRLDDGVALHGLAGDLEIEVDGRRAPRRRRPGRRRRCAPRSPGAARAGRSTCRAAWSRRDLEGGQDVQLAVETRVGLQPRREVLARHRLAGERGGPARRGVVGGERDDEALAADSDLVGERPQLRAACCDSGDRLMLAPPAGGRTAPREGVEAPPEAAVVRVDGAELVADDALDARRRTRAGRRRPKLDARRGRPRRRAWRASSRRRSPGTARARRTRRASARLASAPSSTPMVSLRTSDGRCSPTLSTVRSSGTARWLTRSVPTGCRTSPSVGLERAQRDEQVRARREVRLPGLPAWRARVEHGP